MAVTSVQAPSSITFPAGMNSVDGTLTLSSGDATSISILGVFTITIKSKTTTMPQVVTFTVTLNQGTTRPGSQSQVIKVGVGAQVVSSAPIAFTY